MAADVRATEGFVDPDTYDRGRPAFPRQGVVAVTSALALGRESSVLDLGAGTGLLSRELAPLVGELIAVEPSRPMLAALRRRLPSVDARAGVAESIPLDDHSVDAVFVAEAFHWFETEEAAGEITRVLAPGGHLVLVWQRRLWWQRRDALPWIPEFERRLEPFWETSARLAGREHPNETKQWQNDLDRTQLFGPFSTIEHEFVQRLSVGDFVAYIASWSWIAILPKAERQRALSAVADLLRGEPELALSYRTDFEWACARP